MVSPVGRPARDQLDLPLRVLLALAAGVGLAFLLDYLDRSVRERSDVEALGLPVLSEIPESNRGATCALKEVTVNGTRRFNVTSLCDAGAC